MIVFGHAGSPAVRRGVGLIWDVVWVLRRWLRGLDLNQRPSGYEPDELPDCSTPRYLFDCLKRRRRHMSAWLSSLMRPEGRVAADGRSALRSPLGFDGISPLDACAGDDKAAARGIPAAAFETCEWVYTVPIEVVLRWGPTLTACCNAWRRPTLPVLEH